MKDCEGCPFALHTFGYEDNRVGNPKVHKWYPNETCRRWRDCHLTPADFPITKAMIAGDWGGHSCKYGKRKSEYDEWCCGTADGRVCVPCLLWTPKGDSGE